MATPETIDSVSAALKGCFPVWSRELTQEAVSVFRHMMSKFPDIVVRRGAQRLIELHKSTRFTVAELREAIRECQMDSQWDAPQIEAPKKEVMTMEKFLERNPSYLEKARRFLEITGDDDE